MTTKNAPKETPLRRWSILSADEQVALRRDYQVELDKQPLTCNLDEKMARFTKWLESRGVSFTHDDLRHRTKP